MKNKHEDIHERIIKDTKKVFEDFAKACAKYSEKLKEQEERRR